MRSGGSVSCLPSRVNRQMHRQTDRQEVQREMAKKRVEKVKGEGGTGQVALCPLGRLTPPLVPSFPGRKVLLPQPGPS